MREMFKWSGFAVVVLAVLGIALCPATSTHAACPDDMISYWKLDEAVGPDYADFVGNNDGKGAVAPAGVADGIVGGAQSFNGDDQGIEIPASRTFGWAGSESFSIELWAKTDGTSLAAGDENNQVLIGRYDAATDLIWWLGLQNDTGNASFIMFDGSADGVFLFGAGPDLTANAAWYHVVVVRDGSTGETRLYVNAESNADMVDTATLPRGLNSNQPLTIGKLNFGDGFHFKGLIDEVALYDRALSPTEIQAHYQGGLAKVDYCQGAGPPSVAPYPEDTLSFWPLDEPAGPTYVDVVGKNNGSGSLAPIGVADGIVGGAQSFNGEDHGIEILASRSFGWLGSESFSIELWAKTDGTSLAAGDENNQVLIGRYDAATDLIWWLGLQNDTGNASFIMFDGSADGVFLFGAGPDLTANAAWYHVVVVRDGSTGETRLYVNAESNADMVDTATLPRGLNSNQPLTIGKLNFGGGFHFKGLIDEVALYDRALTVAEIQAHYDAGMAGVGVAGLRPAPVANAGPNQTGVKAASEVTLDGSGSTPGYPEAPITQYLWEQTGGPSVTLDDATSATPTFNAPANVGAAGVNLTFRLTVTAEDDQQDADTVTIGVVALVAPLADAGPDQTVTAGDTVELDGSGSSDADGDIVAYAWVQTGGLPAVTLSDAAVANPTFTAPEVDTAEAFTFELTVTDDDGLEATDTVTITVEPADPPAPPAPVGSSSSSGCFINSMF